MASEEEKADAAAAERYPYGGIHGAAEYGDVPALRHFLRANPGRAVHEKDSSVRRTPLHFAARYGHVAAAELLLSKGAAVDAKDNDGKTPLDRARENGKTEIEQLLLNLPAKKASAEDGKMPPDLSNKGKAEIKPLSTAADKTSEDPSSPAGSGAAAAKHQREASKEEAAQELKKAMESDNAQALKQAIDKAKLHKVSPEEVMEAMDKYIALRETADGAALSPAEEAAKALKKAMESGNVQNLKEAIAAAKAQKVNHEDVLEAMDKLIALTESAATSKAEKSATPSKAERSVKLEPGHGARLAMFSARFNEKNKDTEMKFRAVHKLLVENHYEILMVEAGAGKSFGVMTLDYLRRLGEEKGVMLAVCTSDYGEMTDSPYCTYYELKLAKEYNVDVLPLQVEDDDNWKPNPPCGEGHRDHSKSALDYIHAVFLPSIVRIDCRKKRVEEIASEIAASLRKT